MKELFLFGRLLLGGYFLYSGIHHFMDLVPMSEMVAHRGIPFPTAAVALAGLLLLIGGVSFLLGMAPRIGVVALVLFLVPVTLMMHQFWKEDGARRMMDLINFTKNAALLGGVLMMVAIPEPWPLSVRTRMRFARHARI